MDSFYDKSVFPVWVLKLEIMKYLIIASLVILCINVTHGQTKLGLKLSPAVIDQRISYPNDSNSISNGSNAFNMSVMLFADISMSNNYFFTTGVGYTSKRINLQYQQGDDLATETKSYNVQYVQIPATLKLYTNEIALDKKLYFQFGPLIDVAVHNKESDSDLAIVDKFQPVDVSLLFAAGLEIQIAPQTAVLLGISYTRGLMNVVKDPADGVGDLVIKNDLFAIDVAIKF